MGSSSFVAVAVFSDNTFATTALTYTFQLSGNPLALNLIDAPVANLPVGSSAIVGAQALFPNGPVDVSQSATYKVSSGASNVFTVDSTGLVTANGPGVDWLDVSYGGLRASAPISVGSCSYALTPVNQIIAYNGGSAIIQVVTSTGCAWTAASGAPWLNLTKASGVGSGTITLTTTPNTTGATQSAIVTVANQDVGIIQPATPCSYVLSQTQINAPATGTSGNLTVTTSCPITATSDAAWLIPVPLSGSVDYTVLANTGTTSRSATLTIGTQTVSVIQAGAPIPVATTALVASANPAVAGQTITFTATVAQSSGSTVPTGTVTFFDSSTSLSTIGLNASGVAMFMMSSLAVGTHSVTAQYNGDGNFSPSSSSPPLALVLNKAATNTSLGSSLNPSMIGQAVVFTSGVTVMAPGAGTPTGTVNFFDGATQLGTGPLNGQGMASFQTTTLGSGSHFITAQYSGDTNYGGSTSSPALTQTVNAPPPDFAFAASSTSVSISAPGASSSPVTLTITAQNGYNGTILFTPGSCSIAPSGSLSSCSFSSASVGPGSGSTQATINTTPSRNAMSVPLGSPTPTSWGIVSACTATVCILFFSFLSKRRRWSTAFGILALLSLGACFGCGSSAGTTTTTIPGTPTGITYTVTVTATASGGQLTHTTTFTFIVQ